MKTKWFPILFLVAVSLAAIGCSKKDPVAPATATPTDETVAINTELDASPYADATNYGDDGTTSVNLSSPATKDFFPSYVRWRRRITQVIVNRSITFEDTAHTIARVTITADFYGRFIVDNTDNQMLDTLSRSIHDQGIRYVRLRKINNRWRVWGCTPMTAATVSPLVPATIDSVKISATSGLNREVVFNRGTFNQVRLREHMPIIDENATITLTVWGSIGTAYPADSSWAFLHRRIFPVGAPGRFNHLRVPLDRQSPFVFTKTWTIIDDSLATRPAVRHACADFILGSTMFGGSGAEYSANMWTVPYIVMQANDSLPD